MNSSPSVYTAAYRRSFVVSATLSLLALIFALTEWIHRTPTGLNNTLIIAGVSLLGVAVIAGYGITIFGKKLRPLRSVSLALHIVTLLGLGALIIASGTIIHPVTILWIIILSTSLQWQGIGVGIGAGIAVVLGAALYITTKIQPEQYFFTGTAIIAPLVVSFLGIARQKVDPTDETLHVLAQELSQVSNKSDIIVNTIGEGVVAIDNRGNIQLINPAAEDITGWTNFDAININYQIVLRLTTGKGEVLSDTDNPISLVLRGGNTVTRNDLLLVTNSGKKINVSLLVSPIGKFGNGAIIVFRDITKEVAENREQAEFISTASHEMRTPVAAIEGYISLALNPQTASIDARASQYLLKAHESANHLGRLFQDLLDVSKAEDGRLKNEPQYIEVTDFVRESVSMLTPKANEKGLMLVFSPDARSKEGTQVISPTAYVYVDRDHLRETMSNLIENAIKYTKQGYVTVDVTIEGELVQVSIADSGIGIAPEDIPHLFQKFYRIDNTDTREIGGTGLGLYLCRRLVESMNGHLWVESKVNVGSTFFVTLARVDNGEVISQTQQ